MARSLLALSALILSLPLPAWGAKLDACPSGCTFSTVQQAVDAAQPGDVVWLYGVVYQESVVVDGKSVTIDRDVGVTPVFLDTGSPGDAVITVTNGGALKITGVSISAGLRRAVRVDQGSSLDVVLGDFTRSGVGVGDGGVILVDNATLSLGASLLAHVTVSGDGGFVHATNSDLSFLSDDFLSGTADDGGAVWLSGSSLYNWSTDYSGNRAFSDGGAIRLIDGSDVIIEQSSFELNDAYAGGAISGWTADNGPLTTLEITLGELRENRAESFASGGAIDLQNVKLDVSSSMFEGNIAGTGGAIHSSLGPVTLLYSGFNQNGADLSGGALAFNTTNAILYEVGFLGNEAANGGAISASVGTDLAISQAILCANRALNYGGGIEMRSNLGGSFSGERMFWVENSSGLGGGAIAFSGAGTAAKFTASHFLANRSINGSALFMTEGQALVRDDLFAYNSGPVFGGVLAWSVNPTYSAFWGHAAGDLPQSLPTQDNVFGDPQLVAYSMDGDCTNDAFYHSWYSSLRDAGSPTNGDDVDGTRRDIGPYGGPLIGVDADCASGEALGLYRGWCDADGDGYPLMYDCADDPAFDDPSCDGPNPKLTCADQVHPERPEVWYDGFDSDCDGRSDFDRDQDGYDSDRHGGDDCDDRNPEINPGVEETPYDGVDANCDGLLLNDVDADGYNGMQAGGLDCDDGDPSIYPGAVDTDSQVDRDCDSFVDDVRPLTPAGCATAPSPASWWMFFLGLLLLRRRPRRGSQQGL